jgi:5'-methylthioadenosine nucleosidase
MEAEAAPFAEHMELKPIEGFFPPHTPFLAFEGTHHGTKVTIITAGKDKAYGTGVDNVGTVPSALATFLALQKAANDNDSIDFILNGGTCGGFARKGAAIGDVFLTTSVAHHDRRIPIPGFDIYGTGKLEVTTTPSPRDMAATLGYKTGICTTGNSLDFVDKDAELMLQNDASVKDMEAASIAWIASMFSVPYLGVKVVTDIVDGPHPAQEEFLANLANAAKSLQDALPKVLDLVIDKVSSVVKEEL